MWASTPSWSRWSVWTSMSRAAMVVRWAPPRTRCRAARSVMVNPRLGRRRWWRARCRGWWRRCGWWRRRWWTSPAAGGALALGGDHVAEIDGAAHDAGHEPPDGGEQGDDE